MSTIHHEVSANQLFDDDPAVKEKVQRDLPYCIGLEKRDIEQNRELCHRNLRFRARAHSHLAEDNVVAKEAVPGASRRREETAKTDT